jgi:hypothetical protein
MSSAESMRGYGWLDTTTERPGAHMQVASCFYFFHGIGVDKLAERTGLRDRHLDGPLTDRELPSHFDTAMWEASNGWTVVYQDNGYPEQYAAELAGSLCPGRAVLVYWNVNARTEFSYWQDGNCLVRFQFPDERSGADPDRLLAEMNQIKGLLHGGSSRTSAGYYGDLLALAEQITGIHLGPDFLDRRGLTLGNLNAYDGYGDRTA